MSPDVPLTQHVGATRDRVDAPANVTGQARYAAEFSLDGLLYGVIVSSSIARGLITAIDLDAALAVPGVVQVFTHLTRPQADWYEHDFGDAIAPPGQPHRPLYDDAIQFSGQPIALVVAEEFGIARHAATLVKVTYDAAAPETDLQTVPHYEPPDGRDGMPPPSPSPAAASDAPVRIDREYRTPFEHHNPMELFAATAVWDGNDRLTVYDKTQGVQNSQRYLASIFGLPRENVRIMSRYVGGAFGAGLRPQFSLFLAAMAARALERPVRVVLNRDQMWSIGGRAATIQQVRIGAGADGKLQSIEHEAVAATSSYEDKQENVVNWSGILYPAQTTKLDYRLGKLDLATPSDMRAPGATTGVFALECAMDELASEAGIDPVELRLRNYAERDPAEDKPFTSKELRAAYRLGAEKFGWDKRTAAPRSMRDGHELVGWGMATGVWEALYVPHAARATLTADGKATIDCATADIGTGTYTILTQIAADALGLQMEDVTVNLGDSSLPMAPVEGGSWTAASAGTAVQIACTELITRLLEQARRLNDSPLGAARRDEVTLAAGRLQLRSDPSKFVTVGDALRAGGVDRIDAQGRATPDKAVAARFSANTHSAVFAEVKIDEELGVIRVTRLVLAVAAGRILNPKTARSQLMGGAVFGLGMALHEESMLDHRYGRFVNRNLGEYHIPAHADVHAIEVVFVPEQEDHLNPLGVKGVAEIGVVGTAAAIANAVHHATGVRVRELPITIDKLLPGL